MRVQNTPWNLASSLVSDYFQVFQLVCTLVFCFKIWAQGNKDEGQASGSVGFKPRASSPVLRSRADGIAAMVAVLLVRILCAQPLHVGLRVERPRGCVSMVLRRDYF